MAENTGRMEADCGMRHHYARFTGGLRIGNSSNHNCMMYILKRGESVMEDGSLYQPAYIVKSKLSLKLSKIIVFLRVFLILVIRRSI